MEGMLLKDDICCHQGINTALVSALCIMLTLWEYVQPIGFALCLDAALVSNYSGLHSCIMMIMNSQRVNGVLEERWSTFRNPCTVEKG